MSGGLLEFINKIYNLLKEKEKKHKVSYSKNNLYVLECFQYLKDAKEFFIAIRIIQIHKIILIISNTYLIVSPSLLKHISANF